MDGKISFKTVYLKENQGHGNARRHSLDACTNDIVALMDADDISSPNRFYKQLNMFIEHPEVSVCGGHITEFIGDEKTITGRREVKLDDFGIKQDLKKRCPMNQVTVMFRKEAYYSAGGYIDFYCEEDYYLWARMIQKGFIFSNVDADIVNVRTGEDMSSRRGGWKYFKSERKMQKYLLLNKIISVPRYLYNVAIRFCGEVIASNRLRQRLFKFMRKKPNNILTTEKEDEIKNFTYPPFSVSMCVYGKDNPGWFDQALESVIINQTIKPTEVVLVVDGPIPNSIETIINKYSIICDE